RDPHFPPPIYSFPNSHTSHKPRHDCCKHVNSCIEKKGEQVMHKGRKEKTKEKKSVSLCNDLPRHHYSNPW
ncbi:hypothetical protein COCVIDRAFT_109989, partial [Bipolaris victoriae FI3]